MWPTHPELDRRRRVPPHDTRRALEHDSVAPAQPEGRRVGRPSLPRHEPVRRGREVVRVRALGPPRESPPVRCVHGGDLVGAGRGGRPPREEAWDRGREARGLDEVFLGLEMHEPRTHARGDRIVLAGDAEEGPSRGLPDGEEALERVRRPLRDERADLVQRGDRAGPVGQGPPERAGFQVVGRTGGRETHRASDACPRERTNNDRPRSHEQSPAASVAPWGRTRPASPGSPGPAMCALGSGEPEAWILRQLGPVRVVAGPGHWATGADRSPASPRRARDGRATGTPESPPRRAQRLSARSGATRALVGWVGGWRGSGLRPGGVPLAAALRSHPATRPG